MPEYIQCFIDGAARNQGDARTNEAAAAVIIFRNRKEIARFARGLGPVTNNVAEYEALISAVLMCSMIDLPRPQIYSDSQLVVKHTTGLWMCRTQSLLPYYLTVQELKAAYPFDIHQVPREKVYMADQLCNMFLDRLEVERERLHFLKQTE